MSNKFIFGKKFLLFSVEKAALNIINKKPWIQLWQNLDNINFASEWFVYKLITKIKITPKYNICSRQKPNPPTSWWQLHIYPAGWLENWENFISIIWLLLKPVLYTADSMLLGLYTWSSVELGRHLCGQIWSHIFSGLSTSIDRHHTPHENKGD